MIVNLIKEDLLNLKKKKIIIIKDIKDIIIIKIKIKRKMKIKMKKNQNLKEIIILEDIQEKDLKLIMKILKKKNQKKKKSLKLLLNMIDNLIKEDLLNLSKKKIIMKILIIKQSKNMRIIHINIMHLEINIILIQKRFQLIQQQPQLLQQLQEELAFQGKDIIIQEVLKKSLRKISKMKKQKQRLKIRILIVRKKLSEDLELMLINKKFSSIKMALKNIFYKII